MISILVNNSSLQVEEGENLLKTLPAVVRSR